MAKYAKKNLKEYKIDVTLDRERLTTKLLPKKLGLKSFVQILEPKKNDRNGLSKYLICESSEPSKTIESPASIEQPECPNGTLLVEKSW